MTNHKVYKTIIEAVNTGQLKEPFTNDDFKTHCPGLGTGTYNAFLHKHSVGNPGCNSELFERIGPGKFILIRPFKYGF